MKLISSLIHRNVNFKYIHSNRFKYHFLHKIKQIYKVKHDSIRIYSNSFTLEQIHHNNMCIVTNKLKFFTQIHTECTISKYQNKKMVNDTKIYKIILK